MAVYRKRREPVSRVTEQRQELQVEQQQVRPDRLELRERRSQASKRALLERLVRLELRELLVQPDKPDKSQVERLSLVPRPPELPLLKLVLVASELEQSLVREEQRFHEHRPPPAEHSELLVQELLDSLGRLQTPQQQDNLARTLIRQRPVQPLRPEQRLRPEQPLQLDKR